MPEQLTVELLERLNERLRAIGARICDQWRPGLTREQIDALTDPHGFRLPDEAALWWEWHNGATERAELTPSRMPLPLESALLNFDALEGGMSDAWGLTRMVGVVNEQPWMYFDCRGANDEPVPVYTGYKAEQPNVAAASIGDMVLVMIEAIDSGAYTTDANGDWNEPDWDNIPEHIDRTNIF